jgi:hypothetical protein
MSLFTYLTPIERQAVLREYIKTYKPFFYRVDCLTGTFYIYEEILITLEQDYPGVSTLITTVYVLNGEHYVPNQLLKRLLSPEQYRGVTGMCIATVF